MTVNPRYKIMADVTTTAKASSTLQRKTTPLPTQTRKLPGEITSIVVCCWILLLGGNFVSAGSTEGKLGDSSSATCVNSDLDQNNHYAPSDNSCRLYMAPTTVGGIEGNYGIFTAVDLPKGATILPNDGPNIPVLKDYRKFPSKIFSDADLLGLFSNVWWGDESDVSDQFLAEMDFRDRQLAAMVDLQINFGALPNCHPYSSNVLSSQPLDGIDYDDRTYLTGDHVNNPLRGSFSYYTGKHFYVDKPVAAGTELFLGYAGDWEQHGFPRTQDFFSAAALVRKWILMVGEKTHQDKISGRDDSHPSRIVPIDDVVNGAKALLKLINVPSPGSPMDKLGHGHLGKTHATTKIDAGIYELEQLTSRILSVLPQTTDEWDEVYHQSWELYYNRTKNIDPKPENATSNFPSVKDVGDAMYNVSQPAPKTTQELKETGICLDHIVAGESKVELELDNRFATESENNSNRVKMTLGRGAMAARFLPKGELIVPVPFLHLLDRSLFDGDDEDETYFTELILNYCFGHSESTLVMCPVTNAVLVNHCSDRNGQFSCGNGGKGPNAEYRWASESKWDRKTKQTLKMTLDDLAGSDYQQQHRMMSMEIVATRDIQEGEEIFIDYGQKWEEAWLEHVKNWSNDDGESEIQWASPLTSFELNHETKKAGEESNRQDSVFYGDLRSDDVILSEDERFMAMCWYEDLLDISWELGSRHSQNSNEEERSMNNSTNSSSVYWKDLSDDEIYSEYAIDVGRNKSVRFTHFRDHLPGTSGYFWPCSILSKHSNENDDGDEDRYVVRIFPSDYFRYMYGAEAFSELAMNLLLKNYPRSSIRFVTAPYQGDQHHRKAFRHHIEIKDELFPENWRNKKEITRSPT